MWPDYSATDSTHPHQLLSYFRYGSIVTSTLRIPPESVDAVPGRAPGLAADVTMARPRGDVRRPPTSKREEMAAKHINAAPGDFAGTVLMPGDPLRAQYIADTYLEDARRVTDVRNMWGFTGEYKGHPISVMAHGMRVMRVGSCGTSHPDVKLRDLIIAQGASTDSAVNRMRFGGYDYAALATFDLVRKAVDVAEAHDVRYHVGNIFSADLFYTPDTDMFETMAKFNVYGVEMEAAGMYPIAAELGAEALAICTVSDDIPSGAALSVEERATTFDEMITVALETAIT
jgi:purine-nucleoside phosphorylase